MLINLYDKAVEAANYLNSKTKHRPDLAIVLGSGLGEFADTLVDAEIIKFEDIPYFKKPTTPGHSGKLIFGKCGSRTIVAMQGRYHIYEGHHITEVVFPIRVFKIMNIRKLILTNAAGGANRLLMPGNLMIISDHINLLGENPLIGEHDKRFGENRFADMKSPYGVEMQNTIAKCMVEMKL
jgi:purine-nucleoside phosphorylase